MPNETKAAPIIQTGLKYKKSTAGTYFYEVDEDRRSTAVVSSQYIKKSAFLGAPAPAEIELEIRVKG